MNLSRKEIETIRWKLENGMILSEKQNEYAYREGMRCVFCNKYIPPGRYRSFFSETKNDSYQQKIYGRKKGYTCEKCGSKREMDNIQNNGRATLGRHYWGF